jgi:DNA-binding response OmpR family regulator
MKIVIFSDELRSEMQMYLTLSNRHDVVIAQDIEDLLEVLQKNKTDLTFLDLAISHEANEKKLDGIALAAHIRMNHPQTKVVGICDRDDLSLQKKASHIGLGDVITRPIRNRELLEVTEK